MGEVLKEVRKKGNPEKPPKVTQKKKFPKKRKNKKRK